MKKEQVLAKMKEDCLVAVVRAKDKVQGEKVVDAIIAGGIAIAALYLFSSFGIGAAIPCLLYTSDAADEL